MVTTIRTSERRTFRRCHKKWQYQYLDGLEAKVTPSKLRVGSAVHAALEAFYQELDWEWVLNQFFGDEAARVSWDSLTEDQRQEFRGDETLARGMMQHYATWAPDHDDFDVLATELSGRVKLGRTKRGTVWHSFRADALIEMEDGLWIMEHKTTSQIDTDAVYLELDDQAQTYAWAFRELGRGNGWVFRDGKRQRADGRPIRGLLYNFLLKQVPSPVRVNKDGSLSKVQSCTPDAYADALVERNLPLTGDETLRALHAKKWFHRMKVYRTETELDSHNERLRAETADMRRAAKDPIQRYRNPTRDCPWDCQFLTLCKGELEGLDMSYYRDEMFVVERQLPLVEVANGN